MDKEIVVKFNGGREGVSNYPYPWSCVEAMLTHFAVTGLLKGYDQLMNLVLDNVKEVLRGMRIQLLGSIFMLTSS